MKVLRISMFGGMHEPPITMVVSENSVTVPLEEAAQIMEQPPNMLIVTEIFESDGRDLPEWTAEAVIRSEALAAVESNMAVLYWWSVAMFPMMADGGVIGTQRTTPLSPDSIILVYRALSQRSDYRSFEFITITEKGDHIVEYRGNTAYVDGEVVQAA